MIYLIVGALCYLPGSAIDLAYTLGGGVVTSPLGFWPTRLADTIFSSIGSAFMLHLAFDSFGEHEVSFSADMKRGLADAFSVFVVEFVMGR